MTLAYRRTSSAPPAEHERLAVDADGGFVMWRSLGPAVGRFAGRVPDPERLADLAADAQRVSAPDLEMIAPGGSLERVAIDGLEADLNRHQDLEGPWANLLEAFRALVDDLVELPVAAIGLDIEDLSAPVLVHRGTEPADLPLSEPTAEVAWYRDRRRAGEAHGRVGSGQDLRAEPGWTWRIPVEGMEAEPGDHAVVMVDLLLLDGDEPRRVQVSTHRTV